VKGQRRARDAGPLLLPLPGCEAAAALRSNHPAAGLGVGYLVFNQLAAADGAPISIVRIWSVFDYRDAGVDDVYIKCVGQGRGRLTLVDYRTQDAVARPPPPYEKGSGFFSDTFVLDGCVTELWAVVDHEAGGGGGSKL
jgi:hypothetical protein